MHHQSKHPRFPHVFQPVDLGRMRLRNRVMLPPHGSAIGDLWGTEGQAERHIAYWEARAADGVSWIDGVRGRLANPLVPGFEPHGYGAETQGNYRAPNYVERVSRLVEALHAHGTLVTSQMTVIGGVPHAPSERLSSPLQGFRPHVLRRDEIDWYVDEYRYSAAQARRAGLDGVELHANHDDLLEWFLSPATNNRDDEYGGSVEDRLRVVLRVLETVREELDDGQALGVRFNLREEAPDGYDADDGLEIARRLEASGTLDFLHLVVGSSWGAPSYIQSQHHPAAAWAEIAGRYRRALDVPVVYTGRVTTVEVAERVLAAGHADAVGMARAYIADPELLTKAYEQRVDETRPCIGGNDCISRQYAERLPFGCAVNPHASNEVDGAWGRVERARSVLVVGGGPAGLELAALTAQSGHRVRLWEGQDWLGGQLAIAVRAPTYDRYAAYLDWQRRRLDGLGVEVETGRWATPEDVVAAGTDVVAVATGARPHRPGVPGIDADHVVDIRDVLTGRVAVGDRVVVIAQDDHLQPLALADHLSEQGRQVELVYASNQPAQLLGRYILGSILARLTARGVTIRTMEEFVGVVDGGVEIRHVHGRHRTTLRGFDTVALACGGRADARLYDNLLGRVDDLHLLGDAFAPRRLVFATRQAYALARLLHDQAVAV